MGQVGVNNFGGHEMVAGLISEDNSDDCSIHMQAIVALKTPNALNPQIRVAYAKVVGGYAYFKAK